MNELLLPPNPVYALFSGGKDSFATAKILWLHNLLLGVVMLDTGINLPEWEDTAKAMTHRQGWKTEVFRTNIRYEWLVWKYGFPGAGGHRFAMNYLKGRAVREYKKKYPGVALASGVRKGESARRSLNAKPVGEFEGVTIYAPLFNWSTADTWEFCRSYGYERPLSYIKLGISGDCLCGSFTSGHEREAMQEHYPKVYERICRIEALNEGRHPSRCRWGWNNEESVADEVEALVCVDCQQVKVGP